MRILGVLLAVAAMGGTAEAAKLSCSGNVLNYTVHVNGTVAGTKVGSRAQATVVRGGQVVRKENLRVTRSQLVPGESLSFSAENVQGRATFTSSSFDGNAYYGVVVATSPIYGSMSANGACVIR